MLATCPQLQPWRTFLGPWASHVMVDHILSGMGHEVPVTALTAMSSTVGSNNSRFCRHDYGEAAAVLQASCARGLVVSARYGHKFCNNRRQ
jgi:hypothetical protein